MIKMRITPKALYYCNSNSFGINGHAGFLSSAVFMYSRPELRIVFILGALG